MGLSLIWAMGHDRVIGQNNELPWRLPSDMAYFVKSTKGKTVLMGRKTFESIGKPLPNRTNVVLTRDSSFQANGCEVIHSIDEAVARAVAEEVMVIGGAEIYRQLLPYANRLLITYIDAAFDGDAFFPSFSLDDWQEIERIPGVQDASNAYAHTFVIYERRPKK